MMMRMKDRRRGGRGVTSAMTPGVGSQLADTIPHTVSVSRQESRRRGSHRGVGVSVASRRQAMADGGGRTLTKKE